MAKKIIKGFVLKTDKHGKILKVERDDYLIFKKQKSVLGCVEPASIAKTLSFLSELRTVGSAIGWELNFILKKTFRNFFLAGAQDGENFIILGSTENATTLNLYNGIMKINNDQANRLRIMIKENITNKGQLANNQNTFDDFSKLNNEMANMQRELTRKNYALEKINAELAQKNRELDQFAYIVSHDLKAPLRGISSVVAMIIEDYGDDFDEDLMEMFELIQNRSIRMHDLISGILSYAKAGRMDTQLTSFELKEMLDEILDAIAPPPGFVFDIPKQLPRLKCSYVQLSQVFTNLLGNAVKYHDKDSGRIELKWEERGALFLFSVQDDGPGIPEKYHQTIFEMFGTANEKSRTDSTGIGLAIVKKLVEQTGGEMGLDSEMGVGSRFWFTWPKEITIN